MRRATVLTLLGFCSFAFFAGCGSSAGTNGFEAGTGAGAPTDPGGSTGTGTGTGSSGGFEGGGGSSVVDPGTGGVAGGPTGGTLTAGDWDDNLNFDLYQTYVEDHATLQLGDDFPSADRVIVKVVTNDGEPIANAHVEIADQSKAYLSAPTGSDGRVLFFPGRDGAAAIDALTVTIQPPAAQPNVSPLVQSAPATNADWVFTLPGAIKSPPTALDLAFVIDTTGSMGDELDYLKTEVKTIADYVHGAFAGVSIHYALVLYRDHGDAYVTRTFDFTSDLGLFQKNLADQSYDGGGDTPEAMEEALALVPQLQWRAGNTARLTFLVADAPPHDYGYKPYLKAVDALRPKGIRLYPVAASGVDPEAEYLMRAGAEATGGRYVFLTDDSGVGGGHGEPHIPCYEVELLSKLLYREIASELTGARVAADPADILRSVGDPQDGVCTLADGTEAYL